MSPIQTPTRSEFRRIGVQISEEMPSKAGSASRVDGVAELLDDRERSERMGASGRLFVERWASPAAVAESYENLFAELIDQRRLRRCTDSDRTQGHRPLTLAAYG